MKLNMDTIRRNILLVVIAVGFILPNALGEITSVIPDTAAQAATNLTVTFTLSSSSTPSLPPADTPVQSVTIGSITGSSAVHIYQTTVTAVFSIPTDESTGSKDITITFPGPQGTISYTLTGGFTAYGLEAFEAIAQNWLTGS